MRAFYLILVLLLFMQAAGNAGAIGISPSRVIVHFKPGLEETFYFTVYNGASEETSVQFYARGEMGEIARLEHNVSVLKPNSQETVAVKLRLPMNMSLPGDHELLVGAVEKAGRKPGRATFVGAVTGVEAQVYVRVPYPGKYASASIDVGDVVVGEPILFKIIASNLGSEIIENATAFIDVYEPGGKKVASLTSGMEPIGSKEAKELYAEWLPSNLSAGIYSVSATLLYDGYKTEAETNFRLGDMLIEILNVTAETISGDIVRFEINLQSFWNDAVPGVYAEVNVTDAEGTAVAVSSTPPVTIGRWSRAKLETFLKTGALKEGEYSALVMLHYSGKTLQKQVRLRINKGGPNINPLYFVVALLVLVIIYLVISKKRSVHNEKQKKN